MIAFPRKILPLLAAAALGCTARPGADGTHHERAASATTADGLPSWTRGAVCYEIFVRSFRDSDGDGVGDLRGLIESLDYINDGDPSTGTDLGANCFWLMPVAVSPSYHGYDVSDYYTVDPEYGTNDDFRRLTAEARRRGIHVIVDLVLNHTSSDHPWFQAALQGPTSPHREWFRWSDRHPGVKNPWGGDNWHRSPVRDEYYYGFFWRGMPDLNFDHQPVRDEAKRIAEYWLREMGVSGFRLDAVSFLVEESHDRVQHTSGTHSVLREFAAHVKSVDPRSFTVGEVWDSTATLVAYYPDQLDAYFAFEVSDSIIAGVRDGRAAGLMEGVRRAYTELPRGRWAPFLRNHDQERTLTALGGDVARARAAATILLTLPGVPFLYYGEEIGMSAGKDGEPEADMGVRTPMQWSTSRSSGFTNGTPWYELRSDWRTVNVELQTSDTSSLLEHHRRLIHLRTSTPALGAGDWVPLTAGDPSVATYLRRGESGTVIIVVNLGSQPLSRVSISSADSVVAPGSHRPLALLGTPPSVLEVSSSGQLEKYVPYETLMPHGSYIMQLP